jgi:hypothetical protein
LHRDEYYRTDEEGKFSVRGPGFSSYPDISSDEPGNKFGHSLDVEKNGYKKSA